VSDTPPPRRRRWFRKRGIDLGDLAVETFAAFLGVFLALSVQNWSNNRQTEQRVGQARAAIRSEIQFNDQLAAQHGRYYEDFIERAKNTKPSRTSRLNGCGSIDGWQGISPMVFLRSAYDTALATGVFSQMGFTESQHIATIYAEQTEVSELSQHMLDYYVQTWSQQEIPCEEVFGDLARNTDRLKTTYDTYLSATPTTGESP
jgi:type II secretory pathway pseudopilin PulG